MAAPRIERRYTPEEYLAYERQAPYKHECIDGKIVTMGDAGEEHNLITDNLFWVLKSQLRGRPCEVYMSDLRVKVSAQRMYTYPDVTAACGGSQFEDRDVDTLLNPTLIIEVLSHSTEAYDRDAKFGYYRQVPALQEYVLVAQDKVLVEHYVRADESWILTATSDPGAVARLPSIGCELPVAEVYRKVVFPTDAEGDGLPSSVQAVSSYQRTQ